jgi:hypothetical protein
MLDLADDAVSNVLWLGVAAGNAAVGNGDGRSPSHDHKSDLEDRSTKYPGPTAHARIGILRLVAMPRASVYANDATPHGFYGNLIVN